VLTDFGIAALSDATQLTATGSIIGSPEFMAPERLRGVEGDPASDLWSLGILLYLAVEGHSPMRRATTMATLAAVLDAPIPHPVLAGPLMPVLSGLLQRDPAARLTADAVDRLLAEAAAPLGAGGMTQPWDMPAPAASTDSGIPVAARATAGRLGARFGIAVALTAVAGVVGAVVWATRSPQADPSAGGQGSTQPTARGTTAPAASAGASPTAQAASASAAPGTLLTPAGIEAFVKALPALVGTTKIYTLTLYADYADFEAPTKDGAGEYDEYTYQDGKITSDDPGGYVEDGENSADLSTIDWSVIPGLIQKSDQDLKVKNPTVHYVIVDPNWAFAPGTSLRVYCANGYGGGYLLADIHGKILDTIPAGS
jgi:hypothetical protein